MSGQSACAAASDCAFPLAKNHRSPPSFSECVLARRPIFLLGPGCQQSPDTDSYFAARLQGARNGLKSGVRPALGCAAVAWIAIARGQDASDPIYPNH